MRVELIPQIEIGGTHRLRVGDVLSRAIADQNHNSFRFAVAYARVSGLNRLAVSIESFINRGGHVAGAIGIDDGITSIELLEALTRRYQQTARFFTPFQTSFFIQNCMPSAALRKQ